MQIDLLRVRSALECLVDTGKESEPLHLVFGKEHVGAVIHMRSCREVELVAVPTGTFNIGEELPGLIG
jgi:hypothetical protein